MDTTVAGITDMVRQINSTADCQALKLIVDKHKDAIINIINEKINDQIDIAKKQFPLLNLPIPTPDKIVKYLGKLIMGDAFLQLQAYIRQAQEIIILSKELAKLIDSISNIPEKLEACALTIGTETMSTLKAQVDARINPILSQVALTQNLIVGLSNANFSGLLIDTSSPEAFINGLDGKLAILQSSISSMSEDDIIVPPVPPS